MPVVVVGADVVPARVGSAGLTSARVVPPGDWEQLRELLKE